MAGVNKAIIVGHLGRDPEVRYTQDGSAVASFSVATTESWTDKASGQKKEKTEWHKIVAFRRLGEICGEYLKRGSQAYIEGKLQTRSWEKDGVTRYTTEIVAQDVQFLGGGGNQGGHGNHNQPPTNPGGGYPGMPPAGDRGPDGDIPF